jgi:hypothetical protein
MKDHFPGSIDLFILKNMGAAIIDFRVCPPLVKCKNLMFSGFIDTLMYGFTETLDNRKMMETITGTVTQFSGVITVTLIVHDP